MRIVKALSDFIGGAIVLLIITAVIVIKVWFWGSLLTSAVKGVSGSCSKTYRIEEVITVVNGNWFCPSKTKE